MKAENHSINDVLSKNSTSFFIPPFQRSYAWGKPEIERYFDDLMRIIDSELDPEQQDKLEHFFGSIVIKEESQGFATRSIVVDGQQRLTTTLLLLIALRDSEKDENNKNYITENYLVNNTSTFEDKIKLRQVTKDWEAYQALVNGTPNQPSIIFNAYQLFKKLITDYQENKPQVLFKHYILAIRRINLAVIFLDERAFKGENPQIIFETLNSLGKPLTLSDLVRNFVLLNMNSEDQSNKYENIWHPQIEIVLDDAASKFFRDYLQYKTASSIKAVSSNNTKEIYHLFIEYVRKNFESHESFIEDIVLFSPWYKCIVTENSNLDLSSNKASNELIKELIRNIFHDIGAEAFKPFVLGLLDHHQNNKPIRLSDEKLIATLETIRIYLIRRRILKLTQGENKNIVLLNNQIEEIASGSTTMLKLLFGQPYVMRFPNDSELRKNLLSVNFYKGLSKYSKFILGKIEEHKSKVAVDFRNPKITIEHIMPQTLTESWKEELGENYSSIMDDYLHNIGNLILTEFNTEMGNTPFQSKKVKLQKSSLNYRLSVINKNSWNEESILEHQHNMISWLLAAFPLPEEYKERQNGSTKIIEIELFSNDAEDIVAGNKPISIDIEGLLSQVKSWQEVFILVINHVKKTLELDKVLADQKDLFGREALLEWKDLRPLIEKEEILSKHYKTLDGKFWGKVDNLKDDTLFIHINISAVACIRRITRLMSKLSMPKDSVLITLQVSSS